MALSNPPTVQSNERDDYEKPSSIGGLIQHSAAILENECEYLRRTIEDKSMYLDQLQRNVSKQNQNSGKLTADVEHAKILRHKEVMNREALLTKNTLLREKSSVLEKYFSSLQKSMNILIFSEEQLSKFLQQKQTMVVEADDFYKQLEHDQKIALELADEYIGKLENQRNRENDEFHEIKSQLRSKIDEQEQQKRKLMEKRQNVTSSLKETIIIRNMLKPQNDELNEKLSKLTHDKAKEKTEKGTKIEKLQAKLQEEHEKKHKFIEANEHMDKKMYETNSLILDKGLTIKELDSQLKNLNVQEEEDLKTLDNESQKFKSLQGEADLVKQKLTELVKIDEENSKLDLQVKQLQETDTTLGNKILEMDEIQKSDQAQIEEQDRQITELNQKETQVVIEIRSIDEDIIELERHISDNEKEHEQMCVDIDQTYGELNKQHSTLNTSVDSVLEQLREINEKENGLDETIRKLKEELDRAKAVSEESDLKLSLKQEELKIMTKGVSNEASNLDEIINRNKQEFESLQKNEVLLDKTREEVKQLKDKLKDVYLISKTSLTGLQELQNRQLEAKNLELEDLRLELERKFKNTERSKTNFRVELNEYKERVNDTEQQKTHLIEEIKRTENKLVKCDRLAQKLRNKLRVVAHVATHDHSSPRRPSSTQQSFIIGSQKPSVKSKNVSLLQSPRSDSSGMTFDPDSVDLRKVQQKNLQNRKRNSFPSNPKKHNEDSRDSGLDVWGFF